MKQNSIITVFAVLIQFLTFGVEAGVSPPAPPPPPPPPPPVSVAPPVVIQSPATINSHSCAGASISNGDCSQTVYGGFANVASPFLDLFIDGVMDGTNTTNRFSGETQSAGDEMLSERFGFFLSGITTQIDRKQTSREVGYDSDLGGFVAGLDYRFTEELIAGLSIGYTDTDADMDLGLGHVGLESVIVLLHGVYTPTDDLTFMSYTGWSGLDFTGTRIVSSSQTATSETEGDQFVAGLSTSYNLNFGGLTILPQLSIDYLRTWIDGFTEVGAPAANLIVGNQTRNSLKSSVGTNISYAWSQSWGVLIPHFRAFYLHEYMNDSRVIQTSPVIGTSTSAGFVTDNPDRDYVTLAAGVSTVLPYGLQLYIDYQRTLAHSYMDSYIVSGGVRVGL